MYFMDIKNLKYDSNGLIPVIIQDWKTGDVLMLAYMNEESLNKTIETGFTHFWSRSRNKLWKKGETSGNEQIVKEINYDCDNDTLLIKAEQKGVACHTGNRSCFYSKLTQGVIPREARNLATKGSVNNNKYASLDFSVVSLLRNDMSFKYNNIFISINLPQKWISEEQIDIIALDRS